MNIFLTILAILPGLIIIYLIYRFDKYEKEATLPLSICFGLGIAIAFPALWIEQWYDSMGIDEHGGFWTLIVLCFISIALTEELVKFIALIAYPFQKKFFNEPLDGIIYTVMIGMGFATIENIFYSLRFDTGTILVRAFTAVPAHAVFAIMMGYFAGLAKFNKKKKILFLFYSLGLAVIVHGVYDFFILQKYYDWLMLFATITLVTSGIFAYRLIKMHQQISPFKDKLEQADSEIPVTASSTEKIKTIPKTDNEIMDSIISDLQEEE